MLSDKEMASGLALAVVAGVVLALAVVAGVVGVVLYKLYSWSTKDTSHYDRIAERTEIRTYPYEIESFALPPPLTSEQFRPKKIFVVDTQRQCDRAVEILLDDNRTHTFGLGFDCEWLSWGQRYPVSLVQVATIEGVCFLFRLCNMNTIPDSLQWLLYNITKVGVEIELDSKYLQDDHGVLVKKTLDLRHLVRRIGYEGRSLAFLAKLCLRYTMNKDFSIINSNWEAEELSEDQKFYAAMDAYVAIKIYEKLNDIAMFDDLPFDEPFKPYPPSHILRPF